MAYTTFEAHMMALNTYLNACIRYGENLEKERDTIYNIAQSVRTTGCYETDYPYDVIQMLRRVEDYLEDNQDYDGEWVITIDQIELVIEGLESDEEKFCDN